MLIYLVLIMTQYPYNKTYTLKLDTGFQGSIHEEEYSPKEEFSLKEWNSKSDYEKENFLLEKAEECLKGCIEYLFE